jgi:hypothetical protein
MQLASVTGSQRSGSSSAASAAAAATAAAAAGRPAEAALHLTTPRDIREEGDRQGVCVDGRIDGRGLLHNSNTPTAVCCCVCILLCCTTAACAAAGQARWMFGRPAILEVSLLRLCTQCGPLDSLCAATCTRLTMRLPALHTNSKHTAIAGSQCHRMSYWSPDTAVCI